MKKKLLRIGSFIVALSLTGYVFLKVNNLVERKDSVEKYAAFFEEENDFDVLFFGTSHVMNGIYPMELWEDYGIVSYNFGGNGNEIPTSYWLMLNALDYTDPEVVVLDCYFLSSNNKASVDYSYLHQSFDAFPLSQTKIDAINDLLDDPYIELEMEENTEADTSEERLASNMLFNFSLYHSRWEELLEEDFYPDYSLEKGAETRIDVVKSSFVRSSTEDRLTTDTVAQEYLRMFIEACQERGIEVLLTYLPFPAYGYEQLESNNVYDVAEEYGVEYINFLDLDLIEYKTDMYDEDSHLNPSGARKVTDYLGQYLIEHYDLTDHREDEDYADWIDDYAAYTEMKNENIQSEEDVYNYLMLLYGDDLDITIEVSNNYLLYDQVMWSLFRNLGITTGEITEAGATVTISADGTVTIETWDEETKAAFEAEIETTEEQNQETVDAENAGDTETEDSESAIENYQSRIQITVSRDGEELDTVQALLAINGEEGDDGSVTYTVEGTLSRE